MRQPTREQLLAEYAANTNPVESFLEISGGADPADEEHGHGPGLIAERTYRLAGFPNQYGPVSILICEESSPSEVANYLRRAAEWLETDDLIEWSRNDPNRKAIPVSFASAA